MPSVSLLIIVVLAVVLLLLLVLKFKLNAFIALLLVSIFVGIGAGMPLNSILKSIQDGMGGTLGFVATVVGLGAIFGQMLESSGGAESMAKFLVGKFGKEKASWAMMLTGFFVAIPVFFDVGLIIIVPIVYSLARDSKRSVLYYGIPLLAGLAVTHSFIPPTPGPVAVAEIINAQLGYVILFGAILGLPVAILAGPVFGKYISKKIDVSAPDFFENHETKQNEKLPSFGLIISIIGVPLLLIVLNTLVGLLVKKEVISSGWFANVCSFIGHPFVALTIATLLAIYLLGIKRGFNKNEILNLSTKALGPAGIIILITGAGGVFKQVLIDSGIGEMLAKSVSSTALPPILLAWLVASVVRVTQGSATVAMITAAGLMAPILGAFELSDAHRALVVIAISSGATLLSHVNDSGFWLVGKYFGLSEKQTLQSWTVMETLIAVLGLAFTLVLSLFV